MREPELWVNDSHGIYMGKIAYEQLNERYKKQANDCLNVDEIWAIEEMDDEEYNDAVDKFTQIEFKTESGQKFNIQFAEGGLWVIPFCFYRSKQANEFFGNYY